jgi:hypothetical protein
MSDEPASSPTYTQITHIQPMEQAMKRAVTLLAIATVVIGIVVSTAVAESRRSSSSSTRLPSGFASQMRTMGITYSRVKPVDDKVRSAALHAASHGASPLVGRDSRPIAVRVTFTDGNYLDHGRRIYLNQAALMLVFPTPRSP